MLIQTAAHAHTLSVKHMTEVDKAKDQKCVHSNNFCTGFITQVYRYAGKYERPSIGPSWSLVHHAYAFTSVPKLLVWHWCWWMQKPFIQAPERVFPNTFYGSASPLFSLKSPYPIWSKVMPQLGPDLPPPTSCLQSSTSSALLTAEADLQIPSLGNLYLSHSVNFIHFWKLGRSL